MSAADENRGQAAVNRARINDVYGFGDLSRTMQGGGFTAETDRDSPEMHSARPAADNPLAAT